MARNRILLVAGACLLSCLGGCATVSVYEPVASAEIALSGPGADLQRSARSYCETARDRGLAAGEASLRMLSETVFGSGEGPAPYWKRINADTAPPADIVRTLRTDVNDLATGLAAMNAQATSLMRGSRPTKEDVAEFERVLIHARQARESLATAAAKVSPRMATPFAVDEELAGFDRAINRAQGLADDLSAARTAEPLAALEPGASRG